MKLESARSTKERHVWGRQVMEKLVQLVSWYDYIQGQMNVQVYSDFDKFDMNKSLHVSPSNTTGESWRPAIKFGVIEMVKILKGKSEKDLQELNKVVDDDFDMLKRSQTNTASTPLLTAVKYGVTELVEKILEKWPQAIYDTNDADHKNIVHVAVEERQSSILTKLMKRPSWDKEKEQLLYAVDINGNNALHLAAKFSDKTTWEIPMTAMHMQWEVKWYEV